MVDSVESHCLARTKGDVEWLGVIIQLLPAQTFEVNNSATVRIVLSQRWD